MRKTRFGPAALAAFLTVALTACAATPEGGAEEAAGDRITVDVVNDLVPGTTLVVWMVPETGSRRRLGSIPPNGRQTFTYLPTSRSLEHRLVAEPSSGRDQTSYGFSLMGVSGVRWEVSGPDVSVVR